MITLDKKHKKAVKAYKDAIQASTISQETMFSCLCKDVGVVDDTPEAEALWDHVFNDTNWTVEYTK